jgi:large subunit ribosomal protein L4
MTKLKIYNSNFDQSSEVEFEINLSQEVISVPTVHQVVKASLANKRQGTASTKNKAAVRGGGAKPFKQKGTGRARQGSNRSPLMKGGGVTFGPSPRDFSQKLNKKMVNRAIQSVLADKNLESSLFIVDKFESNGKTKDINQRLVSKNMLPALVISESSDNKILLAARNIQYAGSAPVSGFSVYESLKFKNLVIEKAAFEKLIERIK